MTESYSRALVFSSFFRDGRFKVIVRTLTLILLRPCTISMFEWVQRVVSFLQVDSFHCAIRIASWKHRHKIGSRRRNGGRQGSQRAASRSAPPEPPVETFRGLSLRNVSGPAADQSSAWAPRRHSHGSTGFLSAHNPRRCVLASNSARS